MNSGSFFSTPKFPLSQRSCHWNTLSGPATLVDGEGCKKEVPLKVLPLTSLLQQLLGPFYRQLNPTFSWVMKLMPEDKLGLWPMMGEGPLAHAWVGLPSKMIIEPVALLHVLFHSSSSFEVKMWKEVEAHVWMEMATHTHPTKLHLQVPSWMGWSCCFCSKG